MTCDRFRNHVVALDAPADALANRSDLREHVASCSACRPWFERYLTGTSQAVMDASADVTAVVMARTSGSACDRARILLASAADEDVARDDWALLQPHLDRCEDCRAFRATLSATLPALTALAVLEPDETFVFDVLARTSRRPVSAAWLVRAQAAWQHMVQRPRFAWEAAYVCTLCWLLVFGQPMAAFEWTTTRVNAVAQAAAIKSGQVPGIRQAVPTDVGQVAGRLAGGREAAEAKVLSVWHRTMAWTEERVSGLFDALTSMWHSVVAWFRELYAPPVSEPMASVTVPTEPPAAPARYSK